MSPWRLEHERPNEWLLWLTGEPDAYEVLFAESGGLARAAYRLASARCRAMGTLGATPTLRELQAAAVPLAQRLGVAESLPISSLLASDGEAHRLQVLCAVPKPPTSLRPSAPSLRRAG